MNKCGGQCGFWYSTRLLCAIRVTDTPRCREMASGAEQINVAVNHVNEISGKNREGIDALMKEVSRFKIA